MEYLVALSMKVRMFWWPPDNFGEMGPIVPLEMDWHGWVVASVDVLCGACASFPGKQYVIRYFSVIISSVSA